MVRGWLWTSTAYLCFLDAKTVVASLDLLTLCASFDPTTPWLSDRLSIDPLMSRVIIKLQSIDLKLLIIAHNVFQLARLGNLIAYIELGRLSLCIV